MSQSELQEYTELIKLFVFLFAKHPNVALLWYAHPYWFKLTFLYLPAEDKLYCVCMLPF